MDDLKIVERLALKWLCIHSMDIFVYTEYGQVKHKILNENYN